MASEVRHLRDNKLATNEAQAFVESNIGIPETFNQTSINQIDALLAELWGHYKLWYGNQDIIWDVLDHQWLPEFKGMPIGDVLPIDKGYQLLIMLKAICNIFLGVYESFMI